MKQLTVFESDDGQIYFTQMDAERADYAFWKSLGQIELQRREAIKRQPEPEKNDAPNKS
jgi:hypothetical protein